MTNVITKLLKGRIVKNAAWLVFGKILNMLLAFFVGLITARYLGPSNYGLIGYASTYTTFFAIVCNLGINSVILKNFVDYPDEEGETLGTTFVLRLISSLLSVFIISQIVLIVDKNEPTTFVVVLLYSLGLLFQIFDSFHQWFQLKYKSKYYAIATLVAYIIVSAYKIILFELKCDIILFALSNAVDYLVVSLFLFLFYKVNHGPRLSFSMKKAKQLLSVSISYILSGLMTSIYASTDKFMLKQMIGEEVVGYYSLASNISVMWVFVLSAIIESTSPTIMGYYNTDKNKYILMCKRMYATVFYTSFLASIIITATAPIFINIAYGEEYMPAVQPLRIVVWYTAFSYLGISRNVWVVCEKKQKYLKYIYVCSAVINIIINYFLIPIMGTVGAALASLITQFCSIFVMPLFFKEFRPNVLLMVEAILLKGFFADRKEKAENND